MSVWEDIIKGIILAIIGTLIGIAVGGRNKMSRLECRERQQSCTLHVCSEIGHLREEQKEIKTDIKDILKIIQK